MAETQSIAIPTSVKGRFVANHGCRYTPEYEVWKALRQRCRNPNNAYYKEYGGRGIQVCARWDSFTAFLEDMGPRPSGKHTIERLDNDKGYCKENCIWATQAQQARNRRSTILVTFDGRTMCLADWATALGLHPQTLYSRMRRGWPVELVLTTPLHHQPSSKSVAVER